MTAVRLMRREGDVWREEAREALGGEDMDARLKALADRLEPPAKVTVFLPRDQILYTEIELADISNARAEIEIAMDGRTPYALSEMRLDWDIDDDGTAQIAAIAQETLEEAASFVRDLGLKPERFAALAEPSDFRRNPDFGRLDATLVLTENDTAPPTFVSARPSSEPGARAESDPVVRVDDATPVMTLDVPGPAPLDPGIPVDLPNAPPRIRTDIGAHAARSRAQSLTAPSPVRIRQRDRAVPTPLLMGLAAALCVGIAAIIWSIFPHATGTVPQPPAQPAAISDDTTGAVAPPPRETTDAVAEPDLSDTPPEITVADLILVAPEVGDIPARPAPFVGPSRSDPGVLDLAAMSLAPSLPPALGALREARPAALVGIEDTAPDAFRLAALPATPATPSAATPEPADYPGAAITTPLAEPLSPDVPVLDAVAALPAPLPADEAEVAATVDEAPAEDPAPTVEAALPETPADDVDAPPVEEAAPPAEADAAPALTPTELARSVPDTAPRRRPGDFSERAERARYNGYTLAELAERNPPDRPSSEQVEALLELASRDASELAVASSRVPRTKPADFDSIVAAAQVQEQAERRAAAIASNTPDTSAAIEAALAEELEDEEATSPRNSPRLAIPSSASVARQATLDDAIQLNRVNLIGVYGSPSDRRALLRLSSGRYVKVKIGDRLDGGTVSAITSNQVQYRKGSRTLSLSVPEG